MEEPIFYGDYSFNRGKVKLFSVLDYVIFASVLVSSETIGFYFAWKDRHDIKQDSYLLADRQMSPYPVSLSLVASFMSAITLLGTPAEIYNYTTIYPWILVSNIITIAMAAHIYIPVFYELRLTSAYEYLKLRFSKSVRTMASCAFVIQMMLYMAVALYAPSLALNSVTGFDLWGSVISVGIVCTIYTAFGGMKAVLWTDCFQVVMMLTSQLVILIGGANVVGGFDVAYESALRTNRIRWHDWSLDPSVRHTMWSLVIGGYFTWIAIFGVNQAMVQRASTCKTLKNAQMAFHLALPGLTLISLFGAMIGFFLSAFYEKCDVKKAGFVHSNDQLLPLFVMDILGDLPGLPGIFLAGLFSGALSTISSGINSIGAVILEDIIKAYIIKDISEVKAKKVTQFTELSCGVVCLGLTVVASQLGGVLKAALSIFGIVGGPLLGVFTLGMFFPWANTKGAIAGMLTALFLLFWIGAGHVIAKHPYERALTFTTNCNLSAFDQSQIDQVLATSQPPTMPEQTWHYSLYTLSYIWYSFVAVFTVIIVGLIVSFLAGGTDPKRLDPKLICPIFDIMFPFCFLPESIRKPLRFGINHKDKYNKVSAFNEQKKRNATEALGINIETTVDGDKKAPTYTKEPPDLEVNISEMDSLGSNSSITNKDNKAQADSKELINFKIISHSCNLM